MKDPSERSARPAEHGTIDGTAGGGASGYFRRAFAAHPHRLECVGRGDGTGAGSLLNNMGEFVTKQVLAGRGGAARGEMNLISGGVCLGPDR